MQKTGILCFHEFFFAFSDARFNLTFDTTLTILTYLTYLSILCFYLGEIISCVWDTFGFYYMPLLISIFRSLFLQYFGITVI